MAGHTLGQRFSTSAPIRAAGAAAPTWENRNSAVTLSLYRIAGRRRTQVATRRFTNLDDNAWIMLDLDSPLHAATYELEMSDPQGKVGWWSAPRRDSGVDRALADGNAVSGMRTLRLVAPDAGGDQIRSFFTFRKPQPDYFKGPTGPDQWGWLEVYPQHAFYQPGRGRRRSGRGRQPERG